MFLTARPPICKFRPKACLKVLRTDGRFFLLTKRARNHSIKLEGSDMAERKTIVYGSLDWRVQWPPRFLDVLVAKGPVNIVLEEGAFAR